ncbi:MAG TPA: 23S rRNA (guanosine(2251)-2'-O)-methyltransferase RlmB [Nevskiaceae bacterium]|nr:23S rRNA (guanosine(2251)-2'-O)-methyltransferase RlmB [Nevskiaceae bacterium]
MSERYLAGWHVVLAALEEGKSKPLEIFLIAGRQDERSRRVQTLAQQQQIPVQHLARSDLDLKVPGLRHQGVLARVAQDDASSANEEDLLDREAEKDDVVLVLDGVQDPHNLGACLRTAEAAGVKAVVIPRDRAASLTPVARKASAGASERLPLIAVTNLARSLRRMKELGYWLTGLAGDAEETIYDVDLTGPLVLVLGAEGEGMRRLTRDTCDRVVKIPMASSAESLNVSVATGVALFEALRQRRRVRGKL